jgi:hypothetical protein
MGNIGFAEIHAKLQKAKKPTLNKIANLLDIPTRVGKTLLKIEIGLALGKIYDEGDADEAFGFNKKIYEILTKG